MVRKFSGLFKIAVQDGIPEHDKSRSSISIRYLILSLAWFLMVAALTAAMIQYSVSPGQAELTPTKWPANNQIVLDADRATLLMFVHPHCPCTRASLEELEKLIAKCQGLVTPIVVLARPSGTPIGWVETDIHRIASRITNKNVIIDSAGVLTRQFGCRTSGSTLLYNQLGSLLFQGGITLARGHSGDNAGRSAIQEILHGRTPELTATPVFGCGLLDSVCIMEDVN
jgi:hypothetical protein